MTKLMRDAFIDEVCREARKNKDIYFLSADFGAKALDDFRVDLPNQFIHTGISEQNMVDLGAGLALSDKQIFLYAMAPFITTRCYEQTKAILSAMSLPVTLIGVGVGLGYDHATLTHFTPEDISIMRALNGIEVLSPSDAVVAGYLAEHCAKSPVFRYIRLERLPVDALYDEASAKTIIELGFHELHKGERVAVVTTGYMTHTAIKAKHALQKMGINLGVIDVLRLKPFDQSTFSKTIATYDHVVTLDEQILDGGLGSLVLEALADTSTQMPVKRMGIKNGFEVVNGNRDYLHQLYGIDANSLIETIREITL